MPSPEGERRGEPSRPLVLARLGPAECQRVTFDLVDAQHLGAVTAAASDVHVDRLWHRARVERHGPDSPTVLAVVGPGDFSFLEDEPGLAVADSLLGAPVF